jgi:hypothetical protein
MPRPKSQAESADATDPINRNLLDQVTALTAAVERVADEIKVLRIVLDEIRDNVGWALNQMDWVRPIPEPPNMGSLPADPPAQDLEEPLNPSRQDSLPPEKSADPAIEKIPHQRGFWTE